VPTWRLVDVLELQCHQVSERSQVHHRQGLQPPQAQPAQPHQPRQTCRPRHSVSTSTAPFHCPDVWQDALSLSTQSTHKHHDVGVKHKSIYNVPVCVGKTIPQYCQKGSSHLKHSKRNQTRPARQIAMHVMTVTPKLARLTPSLACSQACTRKPLQLTHPPTSPPQVAACRSPA
jgi:hypothetical protein